MATDDSKPELHDLESDAVRDAFDGDGDKEAGRTETGTATKKPEEQKTDTPKGENVELQPLNNEEQTKNVSDFQSFTSDVSFYTKVRLLLWKNFKIQMLRRPWACACKCCIPVLIMLIMASFTAIPGIRSNVDEEYGYEFEYILSNTGDGAQYTNSPYSFSYIPSGAQELPWPDTSVANEWMKYLVCNNPDWGQTAEIYDKDPPGFLAIVADGYETNDNLQALLSILADNYGDSQIYPQEFLGEALSDGSWSIPFGLQIPTTSEPMMQSTWFDINGTALPTAQPTAEPTEYYTSTEFIMSTTGLRRRLLQVEEEQTYEKLDPLCDLDLFSASPLNATLYSYFPPKCLPYSCWTWARDTTYLNFTEGSLLKFFNTEQELEDYISDIKYGASGFNLANNAPNAYRPIGAAIIFEETGGDDGLQWQYKLRFNESIFPDTETPIDIFTKSNEDVYYSGLYYYLQKNGLPWFQTWIDQAIMQYGLQQIYGDDNDTLSAKMEELKSKTVDYSKGVFQFPTFKYQEDAYWPAVGPLFPFFLFIMFCYPIITVLSILVTEKRSKIKEGMKMMGATTSAYWTSWIIYFFVEFTLMTFLVTVMASIFGVFRYSSFGIIFLWFWLFCLSSAGFGMMFSTIFDNPKTGSLFGLIAFFAVLIGGQSNGSLDAGGKRGLCLLSPACFVTGIDTIVQYESSTLGVTWENYTDEYNDFTFETCLVMMFVDIIIYILLTIYLDQVWPSAYGQKQPFYFVFLPSYWRKKCGCNDKDEAERVKLHRRQSSDIDMTSYEKINQETKGEALITIRELTKTFKSFGLTESSRKEVKAVQQISLDMYRGEVFCLLGHNGAGKTTTISMMTGLLEITDGNAWIMNHDISDSAAMSEIRKHLGVCPQHDVLWDRLTVKEHLWLFARLKGVPNDVVQQEVDKIALDTGLSADGNDNKMPPQMSGGQRRKLSLGIALIGGSQIVFLDEPTSGMDPQSRRITWDLISKEKKNRCMILTTHFMDEADILGDRIAIMGGGKVKCCGSALFLKQQYGVGYTFTVSLEANDDTAKDIDNIKKKVDDFVFDSIKGSQEVALAGSELTYRLPFEQTASFSKLFDILDDNKDKLYIKSYGISVTTLEEVFLKIGHDEIDDEADFGKEDEKKAQIRINEQDKADARKQFKQPEISSFALQEQNAFQIFFIHVYAVLYKRFWWSLRDFKALVCSLCCPVALSGIGLGLATIQIAVNQPPLELSTVPGFYDNVDDIDIYTTNDTSGIPNGSFVPIPDNFYSPDNTLYATYDMYLADDNGEMTLQNVDVNAAKYYDVTDFEVENENGDTIATIGYLPIYKGITEDFQDFLLNTAAEDGPNYNAFLFFPYSMTSQNQKRMYFGVNGSALHGLPISINLWNNWIFKDIVADDGMPSIKAIVHPLPVTERQDLISGQISGFVAALYLVIAFCFIPAGAIYFMVNEKSNLTKHQQLVSGISFVAYWTSNYIADICIGLPASILVFLSVYVFDSEAFQGDAAGPFFLTLIMFLFSSFPFTYLLSFVFSSPAKAQLTTILIYIVFGMILGLAAFILDAFEETQDTNSDLKPLYRIFPVYIMCESLLNISLKPLRFPFDEYNDWDVCGRNYLLMFIEGVGYFALVLLLEYLSTFPALLSKLGFVTNRPLTETDDELDPDVLEEKKRIMAGIKQDETGNISVDKSIVDDTVVIAGLRKVYKPKITAANPFAKVTDSMKVEAVKNLYYGVKQSEVFGFLGVNGAGKTTTLATLTGERYPSSGSAFIANFPISNQLQCRRYVGYCPQFDAIFELLTAAEHLKFYAMIKGLKGDEADEQVKVLLSALTLNKYKNRTAGTYSGGNKRKLSVAVSMIGNPPVIFLDEPSTGMDPVSRRHMWEFISTTMAGRCVILTTHSMEECEALCNRVGIMVNGQLKCIGTAQHLKSRYGKGYQLDITLTQKVANDDEKEQEAAISNLQTELAKAFGVITLIEHNGSRISYELVKEDIQLKLGQMFNILEDIKLSKCEGIIQAYALSQTTLEQIFIRMAKQGMEHQEEQTKTVIMDPGL